MIYDTQETKNSTFPNDSDFWAVCWKAEDGKLEFNSFENEKDTR